MFHWKVKKYLELKGISVRMGVSHHTELGVKRKWFPAPFPLDSDLSRMDVMCVVACKQSDFLLDWVELQKELDFA